MKLSLETTKNGVFFALLFLPLVVGFGFPFPPLEKDNVAILAVEGFSSFLLFVGHDSYSVGDRCYCESTFDHQIGEFLLDDTPLGPNTTIRDICNFLGPGPGSWGRPRYNDIQCGNGPPNADILRDEILCPGQVDHGVQGCGFIGPKWNFDVQSDDNEGTILSRFWSWLYLTVFGVFAPLLFGG